MMELKKCIIRLKDRAENVPRNDWLTELNICREVTERLNWMCGEKWTTDWTENVQKSGWQTDIKNF